MKKTIYRPPEITVVDFKVEHCFESNGIAGVISGDRGLLSSRMIHDEEYTTGERYTGFTDDQGEYANYDW